MAKAGQAYGEAAEGKTINLPASNKDMIHSLGEAGYYTVGSGAATWFAKDVLTGGFQDFHYEKAQSAERQCNFLLENLQAKAKDKPFFGLLILLRPTLHLCTMVRIESYTLCKLVTRAFPPVENPEERVTKGVRLHDAQIKAAEHLDQVVSEFLPQLPDNTLVMVMADHGECFGEDGFWGHGIYHPKVMEIL